MFLLLCINALARSKLYLSPCLSPANIPTFSLSLVHSISSLSPSEAFILTLLWRENKCTRMKSGGSLTWKALSHNHNSITCCLTYSACLPVTASLAYWLNLKVSASRAEDLGFESRLCWDFSGSSHTSDFKIGIPVATLPGAWRYRVSAGTGWPSVSIL